MKTMKLITKVQMSQLLKNGERPDEDHMPVVKLFTPDAGCTWLLSEIDPEDQDIAFGLCDLGLGFPELGSVYLPEIKALRGRLGLPVERDKFFEGKYLISVYAEAARMNQAITLDEEALQQAARVKKS